MREGCVTIQIVLTLLMVQLMDTYDDPLDQDNTTIYDFLEIGQVPSITLNLDAIQ